MDRNVRPRTGSTSAKARAKAARIAAAVETEMQQLRSRRREPATEAASIHMSLTDLPADLRDAILQKLLFADVKSVGSASRQMCDAANAVLRSAQWKRGPGRKMGTLQPVHIPSWYHSLGFHPRPAWQSGRYRAVPFRGLEDIVRVNAASVTDCVCLPGGGICLADPLHQELHILSKHGKPLHSRRCAFSPIRLACDRRYLYAIYSNEISYDPSSDEHGVAELRLAQLIKSKIEKTEDIDASSFCHYDAPAEETRIEGSFRPVAVEVLPARELVLVLQTEQVEPYPPPPWTLEKDSRWRGLPRVSRIAVYSNHEKPLSDDYDPRLWSGMPHIHVDRTPLEHAADDLCVAGELIYVAHRTCQVSVFTVGGERLRSFTPEFDVPRSFCNVSDYDEEIRGIRRLRTANGRLYLSSGNSFELRVTTLEGELLQQLQVVQPYHLRYEDGVDYSQKGPGMYSPNQVYGLCVDSTKLIVTSAEDDHDFRLDWEEACKIPKQTIAAHIFPVHGGGEPLRERWQGVCACVDGGPRVELAQGLTCAAPMGGCFKSFTRRSKPHVLMETVE